MTNHAFFIAGINAVGNELNLEVGEVNMRKPSCRKATRGKYTSILWSKHGHGKCFVGIGINPPKTLSIRETEDRPDDAVFVAEESGYWYSLDHAPDTQERFREWNHKAFDILYKLFQMTVTDVSTVRTPSITIAR